MKRSMLSVGILIFAALIVLGCSQPLLVAPGQEPPSGSGAVQYGEAMVENVDVQILESFPVQVHVVVTGYLPDGCTTLDEPTTQRNGNEFVVTLTTQRPADAMCTQALQSFEVVVPLDVEGLPAGQYTVDVNGVSTSFELAVDNVSQDS
ncbi:MAG: hypothetical protein KDI55_06090 [Anaerolineae bacterium]|nr:hypothetical protein [Anaerolineae bacterium]MCB0253281.1 hypothetical protein [Anaerolineae bacterium]